VRFSPLVDRIAFRGAATWSVHMEAARMRDVGQDVIILTVGDPDQSPPEPVIEATIDALRRRRTGYSAILGYPRVRQAIAARFQRRTGHPCVGASGARLVTVPLRADRGFHPDLDAIAAAVTPRTRIVWINSPHNPTGVVFTAEEIAGIAELCRARDLWLVSDEVYEDLAFSRPHVSPWSLPDMAERTVIVSSLSKSLAMPAFRFGWIIGPASLSPHLFDLLLCVTYGSPAFIQDGVLAALESELPDIAPLRDIYRDRARLLSAILAEARNCRLTPPEGGMFVMLDVRGTGLSSEAFAHELLSQERVAVLPCDSFGPSAAGHLRISLTAPEPRLAEAGRRIVRFADTLT